MNDRYLILHKVRGEPAFDVAIQVQAEGDDEPLWVVWTSGHRAYPIETWPLFDLVTVDTNAAGTYVQRVCSSSIEAIKNRPGWEELTDHFEYSLITPVNKAPDRSLDLLVELGLIQKMRRS